MGVIDNLKMKEKSEGLYGNMFGSDDLVPHGKTPEDSIIDGMVRFVFIRLDWFSLLCLIFPKVRDNPPIFNRIMGIDTTALRPITIRIDLQEKNISVLDDNYGQRVLCLDLTGRFFWNERGTRAK